VSSSSRAATLGRISAPGLIFLATAIAVDAAPPLVGRVDLPIEDPRFATAADLDGDGFVDVAALSDRLQKLVVYYGRGDGTFRFPPEVYLTDEQPIFLAIGDLTNDGMTALPDILVVTRRGTVPVYGNVQGDLSIFRNSGDPAGSPTPRFAASCDDVFLDGTGERNGNQPAFALLHDFDQNGRLDIIAPSELGNSLQSLYEGHSAPSCVVPSMCGFGLASCLPVLTFQGNPRPLVAGAFAPRLYFNTDVAALNTFTKSVTYHVHANLTPEPFFTISQRFDVGDGSSQSNPTMMVGGDITGDGLPDLIVSDVGTGDVAILIALDPDMSAQPIFSPSVQYPAFDSSGWLALGEFELGPGEPGPGGPPNQDVVVTNVSLDRVSILPGPGDGSLWNPHTYPAGAGPLSVEPHDFDGDGLDDLLVTNSLGNSLSILRGRTALEGGLDTAYRRKGDDPATAIETADVDGDGDLDVVSASTSGIAVLLGRGDGRLDPTCRDAPIPATRLASARFDADGRDDIAAIRDVPGELTILLGTAAGHLSPAQSVTIGDLSRFVVAVRLDGAAADPADVVVGAATGQLVEVFTGLGDGRVDPSATVVALAFDPIDGASGALDGQPGDDVVVVGAGGEIQVLASDGAGGLVAGTPFASGAVDPVAIITGMVDGDAFVDLVVSDGDVASSGLVVLLGDGTGGFVALAKVDLLLAGLTSALPARLAIGELDAVAGADVAVLLPGSELVLTLPFDASLGNLALGRAVSYGTGRSPRDLAIGPIDTSTPGLETLVIADGDLSATSHRVSVLGPSPHARYPPADAGRDRCFCRDAPTIQSLGSSPIAYVDYSWSPTTLSDPLEPQPTTDVEDTFTLTVTNPQTGVLATDDVVVYGEDPPTVTIQTGSADPCGPTGDTVVLDAGAGYHSYLWSTGGNGRFLEVDPSQAGLVSVEVTTPGGCVGMDSIMVDPGASETFVLVASVSPAEHCETDPAIFVGDATATTITAPSTLTFAWSIAGNPPGWTITPLNPEESLVDIVATGPPAQRSVTVHLAVTAQPSGCTLSRDFDVEVVTPAATADVGNSVMAVRTPGGLDLTWASASASSYDVFSVATKAMIPIIDTSLDTTSPVNSVSLTTTDPERYYQVRGSCP